MDNDLVEFDLILHGKVCIAKPPVPVWDCLARLTDWKESVVSVERMAGSADTVGEVLRIGQRPAGQTVYVLQTTLGLAIPHWKTQSLVTEDGVTTSGYITYSLVEQDRSTIVICNVTAKVRVPAAATEQAGGLELFARAANASTREKLEADHRKLKQFAERKPESAR